MSAQVSQSSWLAPKRPVVEGLGTPLVKTIPVIQSDQVLPLAASLDVACGLLPGCEDLSGRGYLMPAMKVASMIDEHDMDPPKESFTERRG